MSRSIPTTSWLIPDDPDVSGLRERVPPLVARLLFARGITTTDQLESFLNLSHLPHDPLLLPDMDRAIPRLRAAVEYGETVGVFGDFDVDGITGTAIMCEGLGSLGARPVPYIPQRTDEGHGLSVGAIDSLAEAGASLIVTVDCGITDADEVAYASDRGVDVIITDHHVPPSGLPKAAACVNARMQGSRYPFADLCGAGLALKVIDGLHRSWGVPYDPALLELAALGSVADLVPLLDENRYLVSSGVERLKITSRPGLLALFETSRLSPHQLSSESISFQIAPRLNAAGRMGNPADSLRLLTTRDEDEAAMLAEKLEDLNRQRRAATEEATELALEAVEAMPSVPDILVVAHDAIPQGVAGLAASRLVETYRRPAVVLSVNGEQAVASARSIPEFDIVEAIASASDLLVRYGGHSQAAGFTVPTDLIPETTDRLLVHAGRRLHSLDLDPVLEIDAIATMPELTMDTHDWLNSLEPFGKANRRPLFASLGVSVKESRLVGNNQQHLRLRVEQQGREMVALAFNQADKWRALGDRAGQESLDLAYTLMLDSWHGQESLALRVRELRISRS